MVNCTIWFMIGSRLYPDLCLIFHPTELDDLAEIVRHGPHIILHMAKTESSSGRLQKQGPPGEGKKV